MLPHLEAQAMLDQRWHRLLTTDVGTIARVLLAQFLFTSAMSTFPAQHFLEVQMQYGSVRLGSLHLLQTAGNQRSYICVFRV